MNFKSLIAGIFITTLTLSAFAQKGEVAIAKENIEKYLQMARSTPRLAAPFLKTTKDAVEKAILHEKTKDDPELWTMRASLYAEMAYNDSTSAAGKHITEAKKSLARVKELDPASDSKESIKRAKYTLYQKQLIAGKKAFDGKNYKAAHAEFTKGLEFMPGDTISNYYAGVAAQNTKDYKSAIKNYTEILSTNFSYMPDVYTNLGEAYAANKDTVAAIKVLGEGFAKYPKSNQLATREIELSINSGKHAEVIGKIETQMQTNPTNKYLPFYLGIAYASGNNAVKAEDAYKKALAVDPNFFEANLNTGSVIMNNGIDMYNAANKKYSGKSLNATQHAEYKALQKKATAEFDRALPYLIKATELDPKSKIAWSSLKSYYKAKSNNAKVAEVDAKLSSL
ncbi:MAG: hypothetical protein H7Y13_06690 [Sphingobacteriaceae bacterium]|nr:hypothetical protein [Sphingobacteriaceae bacterium]